MMLILDSLRSLVLLDGLLEDLRRSDRIVIPERERGRSLQVIVDLLVDAVFPRSALNDGALSAAERARVLAQNLPAAPLDDAIAHADYRLLQLEETIRAGIERLEAEN